MAKKASALAEGRPAGPADAAGFWWDDPKKLARRAVRDAASEVIDELMARAASSKRLRGRITKAIDALEKDGRGRAAVSAALQAQALGFYEAQRGRGLSEGAALAETALRFNRSVSTIARWNTTARRLRSTP